MSRGGVAGEVGRRQGWESVQRPEQEAEDRVNGGWGVRGSLKHPPWNMYLLKGASVPRLRVLGCVTLKPHPPPP